MVPARRFKVPGRGGHICTIPLYIKPTSHSGNNIGIMLGVFLKKKYQIMSEESFPILYSIYKIHTYIKWTRLLGHAVQFSS